MTIRPATNKGNRETTFYVMGDSGREYIIHHKRNLVSHRRVWTCNCPDWTERRQFNGTFCKHIMEVQVDQAKQALLKAAQANPLTAPTASAISTPTVKQFLDTLVQILNGFNGRQLWNVISALRGPDNGHDDLKGKTTAALRGALGINSNFLIVSKEPPMGAELSNRWAIKAKVSGQFSDVQDHFSSHFAEAVLALKELGYIK